MCGRYKITKPVTKTVDLVKTNIKVEDVDNFNAHPADSEFGPEIVTLYFVLSSCSNSSFVFGSL